MTKTKKIILIVSFIVVLLLLIAFFLSSNFKDGGIKKLIDNKYDEDKQSESLIEEDKTQIEVGDSQRRYADDVKKIIRKQIDEDVKNIPQNIAEAYSSVDKCNIISDSEEKDRCIVLWAEYALDKNLCDNIEGDLKSRCIDKVRLLKAIEEKDIDSCSEFINKGYRSGCIVRVIEVLEDSDIDCMKLSIEDRKTCQIFIETRDKQNVEECKLIEDQEIKNICLDNFYDSIEK